MSEMISIIPKNLVDLLKDLAKNVLSDKPDDIYSYAFEYFENRIVQRDGSLTKDYEFFDESDKYFSKRTEKYILCPKNFSIKQNSDIFPKSLNKIVKRKLSNAEILPITVTEEESNEKAKDDRRLMIYRSLYETPNKNIDTPEYNATLNCLNIKKNDSCKLFHNKRQPKNTSSYDLYRNNETYGDNQYFNSIHDLKQASTARSQLNIIKRKESKTNKNKIKITNLILEDTINVLRRTYFKKFLIHHNLRNNINFTQSNVSNAITLRNKNLIYSKSCHSPAANNIENQIVISLRKDEKLLKMIEFKQLNFHENIQWIFKANKENAKEHNIFIDLKSENKKSTNYETNYLISSNKAIAIASPFCEDIIDQRCMADNHQIMSVNGNTLAHIEKEKTKIHIQFILASLIKWYEHNCDSKSVVEFDVNQKNLRIWYTFQYLLALYNINNTELHIVVRDEKYRRSILEQDTDRVYKSNNRTKKLSKRSMAIDLTNEVYTDDILLHDIRNLPVSNYLTKNPETLCEYNVQREVYTIGRVLKNLRPKEDIKKELWLIIFQEEKFKNILDICLLTKNRNRSDNFLQNNANRNISIALNEEKLKTLTKNVVMSIESNVIEELLKPDTNEDNSEVNGNIANSNLIAANQNHLLTNILFMEHLQMSNAINLIKSHSHIQTECTSLVKNDNRRVYTLEIFCKYVIKRQNSKISNIYKDLMTKKGINNEDLVMAINALSDLIFELSKKNIDIERTQWLSDMNFPNEYLKNVTESTDLKKVLAIKLTVKK